MIVKLSRSQTEYKSDIPIYEGYKLDSIQFVTLLVEIENTFSIEFDDDCLTKSDEFTIESLANMIKEKKENTM